jgi:hypothetical protein
MAFCVALKCPTAHSVQRRLDVAVPAALTYVPELHVVQTAQAAALLLVLNAALPHAAQLRSAVALPASTTCGPATQVVCAVHAVADVAS